MSPVQFPPGFLLGAATAAYQIEGAAAVDGRTPSIWDTFSKTPGKVREGHTGDVACDHYHRLDEDLALMGDLGLAAYRFSVSWSRVQPGGRGGPNAQGLDFYKRLVDGLLERGIEPWLTMYHWDLPQELEDAGGWPVRDTAQRFRDYAVLLHDALGDRVSRWSTLNEPWCSALLGYSSGDHAPGRQEPADGIAATHHLLLGHGLAVQAFQERGATTGITLNLYAVSPETSSAADADAARRIDGLANRLFLDPVLKGSYPEDVKEDLREITDFGFVQDGDLALISQPLPFLGINYYSRHVVSGAGPVEPYWRKPGAWPGSGNVRFVERGVPKTAMNWEIDAPGLVEVLTRVAREYPSVPLYITENGAAFDDKLADGAVDDADRVAYLDAHLRACVEAVEAGAPLRGYFAWSLMDNFEWAWGYTRRFGMIYVDYEDGQRRIPKRSAGWYADVIRSGGLPAE
ncbi:beta-glucosidase [Virgisporangium aliadipatigenens]|uniref:Beta-glucosidase n=1 Tax=Virgisporangium aliadipatigenens TaxID=741659 RepID=A0A8J4DRP2_9ACTN|nr:GH1 family beta-glucosidase [Virgisporangium aliadipatigenens]GIJ46978.1 beta-glucosidase [Virgisporangium aliadipatigenens]